MKREEVDRIASKLEKPSSELADLEADRDVELVLVDAPQSAILSFMAGLNKDSDNYVGVAVDGASPKPDSADNKESSAAKATTELAQYSRGVIGVRQKDAFWNRHYAFTDTNGEESKLAFDSISKEEPADERGPQSTDKEIAHENQKKLAILGRARRIASWEMKADQAVQDSSQGDATRSQDPDQAKLRRAESLDKAEADAENSNWQVLFVLSPDREAEPNAPALKATK